jgi:DNA-binding MarR family transcriptional regulator
MDGNAMTPDPAAVSSSDLPAHASTSNCDIVDFGPMEQQLGFLLRLAQIEDFKAFYRRFGQLELRPGEYSTLIAIGINPGIRQGVLASALMIKRSNMAKMIGALAGKGLVRRQVPDDDKRAFELHPTPKSRALVRKIMPDIIDHDRGAHRRLDAGERELLIGLLRRMIGRPDRP